MADDGGFAKTARPGRGRTAYRAMRIASMRLRPPTLLMALDR
jgi:hypothetical protein